MLQAALETRPRAAAPRSPAPPMVTPFAHALDLLGAYTPQDRWLGNRELAERTGLPAWTSRRIAQCLVQLGYLYYGASERKYRLATPVLALGYAAVANSSVRRTARVHMQALADSQHVHVNLSARDRLDLIVMESCRGTSEPLSLNLHVGARMDLASSPLGWALLAGLPEMERFYLMEGMERHAPREWLRQRRRLGEAIAQVSELGYCTSIGEGDPGIAVIAAPIRIEGHAPFVLACVGAGAQGTRGRVQRELGPRLLAAATAIQQSGAAS